MRSTSSTPTASILLPTDFEQPARRAFAYGLSLAGAIRARVKILHVIMTPTDSLALSPDSRYLNSLKTSALLQLGRLARLAIEAGVPAEPQLDFGSPDGCILEAVEKTHPRVMVMGTEGREGWDRLRLGSTAESVIRQAPCPVLAVHGGLGEVVRRPTRVKLTRWLWATDLSPSSEAARRVVSVLARWTKAKVCVMYVSKRESAARGGLWKLNRLAAALRRQRIEVEGMCTTGEPIEAILNQAARWQADVIVVGTKGRRGLPRLVLGSVAEGVLRRAGCPVLVAKHAAAPVRMGDRDRRSHTS
jgi:nucleotide-binding universal stress UspA family protein